MNSNFSMTTTAKKAGGEFGSVTISFIVASIAAFKLQPLLAANGVEINHLVLTGTLLSTVQSIWISLKNWWKHRNKGK